MYYSLDIREAIVVDKNNGKTLLQISEERSISYSTIKRIWSLYQKGGK